MKRGQAFAKIEIIDADVPTFWERVQKSETCWTWQTFPDNYGSLVTHGAQPQTVRAHRYSWVLHFGPIPEGLLVCHRCDNPPCVRPDHLFVGTYSDNTRDMVTKGRVNRGMSDVVA